MTVSFYAELPDPLGYRLACHCGASFLPVGVGALPYRAACELLVTYRDGAGVLPGCTEDFCAMYGPHLDAIFKEDEGPEVNMANGNARAVFHALGLLADDGDFSAVSVGSEDAESFMGRVLMGLGVAPVSAERPDYELATAGGARMVVCGVPEGYVQDRLSDLLAVAEFARRAGRRVVWG